MCMGLFPRKKKPPVSGSILQSAARAESQYALPETQDPCEPALYAGLRRAVPVIDAAIGKIVSPAAFSWSPETAGCRNSWTSLPEAFRWG